MQQLVRYHRPESIADALDLLGAPGRMALAGGTTFRHDGGAEAIEVVDLQALGLDGVESDGERVTIGAATTLQAVADDAAVPDLIRRCARAELPSTLRSLATIGGTIATAESESVLTAALLVHDAEVGFADGRAEPLADVLATGVARDALIVAVTVAGDGTGSMVSTGRTPADVPIVAAVARRAADETRLALTGVATTPVLVDPDQIDRLDPPGDFRGSADYRRRLAHVLASRALGELS